VGFKAFRIKKRDAVVFQHAKFLNKVVRCTCPMAKKSKKEAKFDKYISVALVVTIIVAVGIYAYVNLVERSLRHQEMTNLQSWNLRHC